MKLYKIKKSKIDNKGRGLYAAKDIKAWYEELKVLYNKSGLCIGGGIIEKRNIPYLGKVLHE